jgi:hypothetical protein
MKKLVLSAAVLVAFTVTSALAGSCPGGGCGDKEKDKDGKKGGQTNQTQSALPAI